MTDLVRNNQQDSSSLELKNFEEKMLSIFEYYGLPYKGILVNFIERDRFFKNVGDLLEGISVAKKSDSYYLSKFLSAISAGLFDAALNYLWNETIKDLRDKVKLYNLKYFYDTLSLSEERRKSLKSEDDLMKLTDDELIKGCKNIELITETGYRELDYIRYMRNWSSAAHPNNSELSALKLLSYLEICLKEVISVDTPKVAVEINKFLLDIKGENFNVSNVKSNITYLKDLPDFQKKNLVNGIFGIYMDDMTQKIGISNINIFLKDFGSYIPDSIKEDLAIRYSSFKINNFSHEEKMSRDFLKIISAESFIPEDLRVVEIREILDNLNQVHQDYNNFYSEPVFAKRLKEIVGVLTLPRQIKYDYIYTLVKVFLTNGNGVARNAEPIYIDLFSGFDKSMACIAVVSFMNDEISSKLRMNLCKNKFYEMLDILSSKIVDNSILDFIQEIKKKENLSDLKNDSNIKNKIKTLKILFS